MQIKAFKGERLSLLSLFTQGLIMIAGAVDVRCGFLWLVALVELCWMSSRVIWQPIRAHFFAVFRSITFFV